MLEIIDVEGRDSKVGVFHRFALMKRWHDSQELPFDTFSVADGVHMNDWGYDCFARNLAAAIGDAVAPAAVAMGPSSQTH
jgi:lysophospholipase L1-like esterase